MSSEDAGRPAWMVERDARVRRVLLGTLAAVWPTAADPVASAGAQGDVDVDKVLEDLASILSTGGEARHVADYLYQEGAEALGGAKPRDRAEVAAVAEELARRHAAAWVA